jgi:hypothetical protein
MKYLYPCKPNPLSINSPYLDVLDRDKNWIAEVKKNGWRCVVEKDKGMLTLWTGHTKNIISQPFTALRETFKCLPDGTMLDGEMIFTNRIKDIPDAFYLFDILYWEGKDITLQPFHKRRTTLELIYKDYLCNCAEIELAKQVQVGKKKLYEQSIGCPLNEGIVLKRLDSDYKTNTKSGQQNPMWLKVKKLADHLYEKRPPSLPVKAEAKKEPDTRPKNIIGWLKKKGGIRYSKEHWKGELDTAIENNPSLKSIVYKKVDKGLTLDQLAMMAYSESWITEATPQALLDAINERQLRSDLVEKEMLEEMKEKTEEKEINNWVKEVIK